MALIGETIVDSAMGRQESLHESGRLEASHASLPSSRWLVLDFGPVVGTPASDVQPDLTERTKCCPTGRELVGRDRLWNVTLLLQDVPQDSECGLLISLALDKNTQHFTFIIDRTPWIIALSADTNQHLVQVPSAGGTGTAFPDPRSIDRPELDDPAPYRLTANISTPFGQHVFDVAIAELETEVEPDSMLDDSRGKPVVGVERFLMRSDHQKLPESTN
jgi:hypothetical protein